MGAGAMTLAELQVILTANIAQVLPQVMEVRRAFGTLNESADQTGRSIDKSVSDTSAKAEKALDSQNKAEDKSAQETKKASQTKRQSLEEIAAIAQRAAERYNQSLAGMTGKPMEFSDNEPAGSGKTATAILAARRQAEEAAQNITSAVDPSRMAQVQHTADQVRQSVDAMFAEERTGSTAAQQAYDAMAAKLSNITARADVLRMRISQMRAEYAKVAAQSDKTAAAMEDLKREEDGAGNAAQQMGRKVEEGSSHVRAASSSASGFQRELSRMGRQIISQILVWQLFFGAIGALGTYMWNALKTNTAFSNSLNNLKVQLLTAFQPIYQAALPALTSLINALAKAMAYIAAFVSGFFGTTYAKSEQGAAGLNKQVKALQDTSKAAQDAKRALAGFDEINTLSKNSSTSSTAATGADSALLNTDFSAPSAKPLISESQIAAAEAAGARVRAIFQSLSNFATRHATIIKGAIAGIVGAFLLFKTVSFITGTIKAIAGAIGFLIANPIVALVLAIGAIVGIVIYLWNTNKAFRTNVIAIWNEIKDSFLKLWDQGKQGAKEAIDAITKSWTAAKDSFLKLWNQTKAGAIDAKNGIQYAFSDFPGWARDTFQWAKESAISQWNDTGSRFRSIWGSIQGAFSDTGWISNQFRDAYNSVVGVWDSLPGRFWNIWNNISAGVRGFLNDIIWPLNQMISGINGIQFNVPNWVPVLGGDHFGLNVQHIPYLAEGGIVSSATAFVAGDAGSEAVLPLQNNTGWMEGLGDVVARKVAAMNSSGKLEVHSHLYLDGREVYQTVQHYALRDARGSNAPAFT